MVDLVVNREDMQPQVLEHVRTTLPDGDPYLAVIEDHRLELRAHHRPTVYTVSDGEVFGYALLTPAANLIDATLDIVIPPDHRQADATKALLRNVLSETNRRVSWWTREPRPLDAPTIAAAFGGHPHRAVLRMERTLQDPFPTDLPTRAFQDVDAPEIVRINNDAFAGHHDRAHLNEEQVHEQLRVFGNRYEDLRMVDGAFCWTKRESATESELFVLAIDSAHQGQGLGPRLLLASMEYVRTAHHSSRVSLYVEHDNARAIALYERNGFVDTNKTLYSVVFPEH
jgi:mycothiol synthase